MIPTAKLRGSLPKPLRAALCIAVFFAGAAAGAASTDANGNRLESVIAVPVAFGSQDAAGKTLNAVLPGAFAVLSAAPDGTRLTIGTLLDQGEPTGEGEEGEGTADGEGEGAPEGEGEGTPDGEGEGAPEGEGVPDGEGGEEGEGEGEGGDPYVALLFTFASADTDNSNTVSLEEILPQLPGFTEELLEAADANGDGELSVAELLEISASGVVHSADINADFVLGLSEILRGIQLYNSGGYACAANAGATEDGYEARAPQGGDPGCVLHALDQNLNQTITLSELLRGIQLFSFQGHTFCQGQSEDDFCERP